MKGLTAVYPTRVTPTMGADVDSAIGLPVVLKEVQVINTSYITNMIMLC